MNTQIISIDEIKRSAMEAFIESPIEALCPYPIDSHEASVWHHEYRMLQLEEDERV